ncbi:TonB-dependent receptor [Novosphingobium sp. Gsoil 351]|uniref:TonB-dependent receptor n=1 Tax=Novosphingobium sp. Gsoil 351 TaxID=2675225 RepID=UPI0012B4F2B4|nr:TonB-dependent receptor [Novosphingobium sp. Gsoil 351]QGN53961.1 TonB-dependent receptor [Novosphingobium sp. Gsoil 351]
MRSHRFLTAVAATALSAPLPAFAQDATPQPQETSADTSVGNNEIVVTARKREETLLNVPVAITAISGDTLQARGINSVREAALLSPGLNINSDGTGRAFVAIRGVGVTLVGTVQPGVGLFIDGIYQPNTAYLNNPLTDVARIEVLRGPQGTFYGKNTLGGAINVITRAPSNDLEVRGNASYAGPDNAWLVSGAVSGPIVKDVLQVRVAASHRQQDGFLKNIVINPANPVDANKLNTDSVNATVRFGPSDGLTLTVKGYYDWVDGVNIPYARVTGPKNYSRKLQFNALNESKLRYRGVNAKAEVPLDGLNSKLTLIGAYDLRNGRSPDSDVDFGPTNFARAVSSDKLRTKTTELRLDSEWSDRISTLFGLFYSRETTALLDNTSLLPAITGLPFNVVRTTTNRTKADTYAAFGTVFWQPSEAWEVAAGLRYDHEKRTANGSVVTALGPLGTTGGAIPQARIKSNEVEPRLTVTRKWSSELTSYASVARGYRGGGFNAPTAPFRTYKGDSAWTYEAGTKYASADRRVNLSAAVFYNDYKDYIGLNSIAPAAGGGLVTVDLNSGDVESYGLELEGRFRPLPQWTLSGGLTLLHARLTNTDSYTAITKRVLSSDRLTFQPDWSANLYSDYDIALGSDSAVTLTAGVTGKGKRLAGTLNQTTPTFLDSYWLTNASITWKTGPVEVGVFANNIFNTKYFESYIEKTTLQLAGLPASDLGIVGDRRRYGVRASLRF